MLAYRQSNLFLLWNRGGMGKAIVCNGGQDAKIIFNRWGKATSHWQSSCWPVWSLPFHTRQWEGAEPVFPDAKRMGPVEFD